MQTEESLRMTTSMMKIGMSMLELQRLVAVDYLARIGWKNTGKRRRQLLKEIERRMLYLLGNVN